MGINSWSRRQFLRNTALAGLGLTLGGTYLSAKQSTSDDRLVILHTNDTHSRLDPFPSDGRRLAGMGGVARRSELIKAIRSKEKHVLLLDAGDIFQGTPYFNLYGGELELKAMSKMGYDASTLGNHEFDNGLVGIKEQLPHANFPFICSNYDFSDTLLKGQFPSHKIFNKGNFKVGVFGLGIELAGLVDTRYYGNTLYLDPVRVAQLKVSELKAEGCNLIIALSHLGYRYDGDKVSDFALANQVEGIDIIIGGHTHTFLDEATLIKSHSGHVTRIHQVGFGGVLLGQIEVGLVGENKMLSYKDASYKVS
ncbi:MAG: metallophosphatase [Cyclobacteriaceae bacterium]|nr:metallophosphatase [Cyclobacteriaceae bacterium]MCH8517262.1 metallophosphatase [Cyclobacteriaceae bacterium]